MFWIPCYDVRKDFHIKSMFDSSLTPVVCSPHEVLCLLCDICVCLGIVVPNAYCVVVLFCFVCLRLVCPKLPVSLDCPFLIAPSMFSNVYLA